MTLRECPSINSNCSRQPDHKTHFGNSQIERAVHSHSYLVHRHNVEEQHKVAAEASHTAAVAACLEAFPSALVHIHRSPEQAAAEPVEASAAELAAVP